MLTGPRPVSSLATSMGLAVKSFSRCLMSYIAHDSMLLDASLPDSTKPCRVTVCRGWLVVQQWLLTDAIEADLKPTVFPCAQQGGGSFSSFYGLGWRQIGGVHDVSCTARVGKSPGLWHGISAPPVDQLTSKKLKELPCVL